jgi:hypothetical protein
MGTLKYDGTSVEFDDALLAHLQVVTIQKLRRQESFLMAWREPVGGGITSIWLHPMAILTFHFATDDRPAIDSAWVNRLTESASSPMGMFVTDAHGDAAPASSVDLSI